MATITLHFPDEIGADFDEDAEMLAAAAVEAMRLKGWAVVTSIDTDGLEQTVGAMIESLTQRAMAESGAREIALENATLDQRRLDELDITQVLRRADKYRSWLMGEEVFPVNIQVRLAEDGGSSAWIWFTDDLTDGQWSKARGAIVKLLEQTDADRSYATPD
jgi:hypothetical protein